jgi:hypothetical protein
MKDTKRILVAFLISLFACAAAWAQGTAQINGVVKDQSGAVLPGVEINATQTATGAKRTVVSDETGSYTLTNLPIGPYMLEAGLPGFRTYLQTGIVLQVGANPVISITLQVGQVAEQVEVKADAALVEARATGVGQMIDNQRVLELPLNGRNATELIFLAGVSVQNTNVNLNSGVRNYATTVISVAGGLDGGLNYYLDGGTHDDPENNLNLPLPFPDALQEFKVETSGVGAQYGHHSAGTVNAVTKAGTNAFHGDLFEFVRNGSMNARNAYAIANDGIKRNQFGGVLGGPIVKNKLFFFGGEQMTTLRSTPSARKEFVPTPQMLAGDFTTFASAQCQGRDVTLAAPFGTNGFARNTIDPKLFVPQALTLSQRLPAAENACGLTELGAVNNLNEYLTTAKVDYQKTEKHSIFVRYMGARKDQPWDYDGHNILSSSHGQLNQRTHSLVIGDTYLLGSGTVNSFHLTGLRTLNPRINPVVIDLNDIGVKNVTVPFKGHMNFGVGSGIVNDVNPNGFTVSGSDVQPGYYNSTGLEISDDLSLVKGKHQWGFGVNLSHLLFSGQSNVTANPTFTFSGQAKTGLALADFLTGYASQFTQGISNNIYPRQTYFALYLQDTWKATQHFTVNYGLRYEPFIAPYDDLGRFPVFFSYEKFNAGFVSSTYPKSPAGLQMPGDAGVPTNGKFMFDRWLHFAPRLGFAWDPQGDGLMVVRAAYGIFNELPALWTFFGNGGAVPWNSSITLTNPALSDPWNLSSGTFPNGYPGGNPIPSYFTKNSDFPLGGSYDNLRIHAKSTYIHEWNFSVQRQVGQNWLFAANYLGNQDVHLWGPQNQLNYAPYTPTATAGNITQRRVLTLLSPNVGKYYGGIGETEDGGTASYNAMLLSVQRRRARGLTVTANYTLSHCIGDGVVTQPGSGGITPGMRRYSRGNCGSVSLGGDRRHIVNLSTVVETPQFANHTVRMLGSGWQISGILKMMTGTSFDITTGFDNTFTGTTDNGRAMQVLADAFLPNRNRDGWLNPAAFIRPPGGVYGSSATNLQGPGIVTLDMGLTRKFQIREAQSVEFRAEAFNFPNHVNPNNPNTVLNSATFGKSTSALDPRILQLALKYVF